MARKAKSRKNTGTQDFSGQDTGYPSPNPAAEARTNKDAQPVARRTAIIDNPGNMSKVSHIHGADIEQRLGRGRG